MNGTKEADLVTAVMLYAIRCLAEGDQPGLRAMGFGPEEITGLRELCLEDLYRAGSLKAHCLNIRLNRAVYRALLTHLRRERESTEVQRALVQADAPLAMMQSLFGVGAREYTQLRRAFNLAPSVGRPQEPDEATSHALWLAWSARADDDAPARLGPEDYLALHTETGASLRAIWNLIERWSGQGDLGGDDVEVSTTPEGDADQAAPALDSGTPPRSSAAR